MFNLLSIVNGNTLKSSSMQLNIKGFNLNNQA